MLEIIVDIAFSSGCDILKMGGTISSNALCVKLI